MRGYVSLLKCVRHSSEIVISAIQILIHAVSTPRILISTMAPAPALVFAAGTETGHARFGPRDPSPSRFGAEADPKLLDRETSLRGRFNDAAGNAVMAPAGGCSRWVESLLWYTSLSSNAS